MAEDVIASLVRWQEQQMPKVAKKLTLRKLSTPPLHISSSKIAVFTPRIPLSAVPTEDKTVPRVCCSVDLERAIKGARYNFQDGVPTRMYLYGFDERDVAQPSVDLTQEPNRAGEVWVVPHRMSNWEIKPITLGELRLSELRHGGKVFIYHIGVGQDVRLSTSQLLKAGEFYRVTISLHDNDTVAVSDAVTTPRAAFDAALNEYVVTP